MRKLSQGERIVLVAGLLLIADLVFLPWHDIDLGAADDVVDTTITAVQAPYSGYGIAAVVLTSIMVLQIVVTRLLAVRLSEPPLPWSQVQLILGVFVAVVLVIKLARLTDSLGYGAYSAILAGLLVAYGAYEISREPTT
jgi:hypothetical protein